MKQSWADTHISAAHTGDNGRLHGHTWRVRAWWPYTGLSIVDHKELLEGVCRQLDHGELPDNLRRAEDIAEHVGMWTNAVRVDVWRDAEGMGASWTA